MGSGLAVLAGLVLETWLAYEFPSSASPLESWGAVVSDALIAAGVFGELLFGHKARLASEELTRRSDEKIAELNERAAALEKEAADARERTAEIERMTAFRRISPEQFKKLRLEFPRFSGNLNILIEYEVGDSEAFVYARDLATTFHEIGIIRSCQNHWNMTAFGLFIAISPTLDRELVRDGLSKAGIEFAFMEIDLSTHLPRNEIAPNLYMFVASKPLPPMEHPAAALAKMEKQNRAPSDEKRDLSI